MSMSLEIILASRSPAREAILRQIRLPFVAIPSDVKEVLKTDPKSSVLQISAKKAEKVGRQLQSVYKNYIVIGCDTLVIDPSQNIMGKPKDRSDAQYMLRTLSGHSHRVLSGCSIIHYPNQTKYQVVITTIVKFRKLSEEEINFYLSMKEWKNRAGAYAIQGLGAFLIEEIQGDYYNIVGLPISWIWKTLWEYFGDSLISKYTKEKGINLDRRDSTMLHLG
ncbi:MAG: Maf family protein [Candidatus Hodarchaeota archaeon]